MLFNASQLAPVKEEEEKARADAIIRASQAMGTRLGGVAACDLAGTVNFLEEYGEKQKHLQSPSFIWLSANLVHPANNRLLFTPLHRQRVGEMRVAVLSVIDHEKLPPWKNGRAYIALPWQEALSATLPEAEKTTDLIILLSSYPYEVNRKIAEAFGSIDIILQSGQSSAMSPVLVNNALITNSSSNGRHLAILAINWQGKGRWSAPETVPATASNQQALTPSTFHHWLVALERSIQEDKEVKRIVGLGISRANDLQRMARQNVRPGK